MAGRSTDCFLIAAQVSASGRHVWVAACSGVSSGGLLVGPTARGSISADLGWLALRHGVQRRGRALGGADLDLPDPGLLARVAPLDLGRREFGREERSFERVRDGDSLRPSVQDRPRRGDAGHDDDSCRRSDGPPVDWHSRRIAQPPNRDDPVGRQPGGERASNPRLARQEGLRPEAGPVVQPRAGRRPAASGGDRAGRSSALPGGPIQPLRPNIGELLDAGLPVRALTRRPDAPTSLLK